MGPAPHSAHVDLMKFDAVQHNASEGKHGTNHVHHHGEEHLGVTGEILRFK